MADVCRAAVGFLPSASSWVVTFWHVSALFVFLCLQILCYLQELQKSEAARTTLEVLSSKAGEASNLKAPSGGAEAVKTREAASAPADPV